MKTSHRTSLLLCSLLSLLSVAGLAGTPESLPKSIPMGQLGATAQQQYSGDGLSIQTMEETDTRNPLQNVPEGVAKPDWEGIQAAYEASRHAFRAVENGHTARSPEQQWLTTFDGRGFLAEPDHGRWQWGLEIMSYGFAGHERRIKGDDTAGASFDGQRLTYQWDDSLQEWYINDKRGLEHGFILASRPEGANGKSPLCLELGVRGGLKMEVQSCGYGVNFIDKSGASVVTYGGLKVWDADGKTIQARIIRLGVYLQIQIDESTAQYPLTIDPVAQQTYLKSSNTEGSDLFGTSVAISGDSIVVGAPGEDSNSTGVNGNAANNSSSSSGAAYVYRRIGATWVQEAYLKASNSGAGDEFGSAVAISGDWIVVGAPREDSASTVINGNQNDNTAAESGAAYVFMRNGSTWSQQAYLKASNAGAGDLFGVSVAASGNRFVVGAYAEDSNATGVDGDQGNNSASSSGAVYVFLGSAVSWRQEGYLKANNTGATDNFGWSVSISEDWLVVGAVGEDSQSTGINGDGSNNSASSSGAAYVYYHGLGTWNYHSYLKPSNTESGDNFGISVSISGERILVGANGEDSGSTGINGDQFNSSANDSGAAYLFARGTTWQQIAYIKASNSGSIDQFGASVALSGDFMVIGAHAEDSNTVGINSGQDNNSASASGAAYVFQGNSASWYQTAYLKASNTQTDDRFGTSVCISGLTVVAGAPREDSTAIVINGSQSDNGASESGASYVFEATNGFDGSGIVIEETVGTYLRSGDVSSHGSINVGATGSTKTYTIRNKGSDLLQLTGFNKTGPHASDYVVSMPGTNLLPVGASTSFSITFSPSAPGSRTAALEIMNNDAEENPFIITFAGSGFGPDISIEQPVGVALSSMASEVNFGSVGLALPSIKTFTVKNTGTSDLGFTVTKSGLNNADFTIGTPASSVSPGASTTFTVTFIPPAPGPRIAKLSIISNDPDENPFEIDLSGIGLVPDSFNPNMSSLVRTVVHQPNGKLLVGGDFENVGLLTRNRIVRLNSDGSVDMRFDPNANGPVYCMAVQADGKTIVGGTFTTIAGVSRVRLARLHEDGSLDTDFNPALQSLSSNFVQSICVQPDGKILIGGSFSLVAGQSRVGLARLNTDGSLDSSFSPTLNNNVGCILVQPDHRILIGGSFTLVNGVTRNRIARLNGDGSIDANFDPNASSSINCLALYPDGRVLLAGAFTSVGGVSRNLIARVDSAGILDTTFNPNVVGAVNGLALQADGKIYLGGGIASVGGTNRSRLARLLPDGTLDAMNVSPDSLVYCLALDDSGSLVVGGSFTSIGVARNRLARLPNDVPATQTLSKVSGQEVTWLRGGSMPEVRQVFIERWDGSAWLDLGATERISGGWRKTGLSLPTAGWIRARGITSCGVANGSSGIVEKVISFGSGLADIAIEQPAGTELISGTANSDFGGVGVGIGSAKVFTIKNTGGSTLTGLAASVSGLQSSEFTVGSLPGTTLAPGASLNLTVTFTPTVANARNATLRVFSSDADETPYLIELTGTGLPPEIAVEQPVGTVYIPGPNANTFQNLGNVRIGSNQDMIFAIRNTGTGNLSISSISRFNGSDDFSIVNNPSPTVIAPNSALNITVRFTPSSTNVLNAGFTISNSDPILNSISILVSGTGIAPEINVAQPVGTNLIDGSASIAYGSVNMSTVSTPKTFTIQNIGSATLNLSGVLKTGGNSADFNVDTSGMAVALAPSASTTFTVTFTPSTTGLRSTTLQIGSDDGNENPFDITLTGTGVTPEIGVEQPVTTAIADGGSNDFGQVLLGSSSSVRSFTIRNTGTTALSLSGVAKSGGQTGDFTINTTGMASSVAMNGTTTFNVTFTPGATGARTTTLQIGSNDLDENPYDITLTGTGITPEIVVEQPAGSDLVDGGGLNYGPVDLGSSSVKTFTIRNPGSANINITGVTKTGGNTADFVINTTGMTTSLAPGGSTTFAVTFTPGTIGALSTGLRIASNDLDENPFDIALTGEGRSLLQIAQQAYLKASNTGSVDLFGWAVAADGDTVVVGAEDEDSSATGINGDETNNSRSGAGAAYVFVRNGAGQWAQQAYLKASNTGSGDSFGGSVAISGDTIVIGAQSEDSGATEINGDGLDNSQTSAGAAYVFVRQNGVWTQQAYLKAENAESGDLFGGAVAIAGDWIVVGVSGDDSSAPEVDGDPFDNSMPGAGAAFVFKRDSGVWNQHSYLKSTNPDASDAFGYSVGISGNRIVVGARFEAGGSTGVNGDQGSNATVTSGAAYVFRESGDVWQQEAYLKASNTQFQDYFGSAVAISGDTIAVYAAGEDSNATGINGLQSNNSATDSGAVYVFHHNGTQWGQQAYIKASNTGSGDAFGTSLALSGNVLLVGAPEESSNATGLNGNQINDLASGSGAVYAFYRNGSVWTQQSYIKPTTVDSGDFFGGSVALAGGTLIVGSEDEDSNATGVGGNAADNTFSNAGAAWIFSGVGLPAPEIRVEQPVGVSLVSGAASSDFGALQAGGQAALTYTLWNTGNLPLEGVAVTKTGTHPGDFTVNTTGMSAVIAAGSSTSFTVTFSPTAMGVRTAGLEIASNDADENPFTIQLTGAQVTPEIVVEQPEGTPLTDGVSAVDFGTVMVSTPGVQTFTIRNTGDGPLSGLALNKSGLHPGDYTLGTLGSTTIAPNGSTTFTVTFSPASAGIRVASLLISSNDADESPFEVTLLGLGSTTAPEIVVEQPAGNGLVDGTASVDFGNALTGNTVSRTFTIRNTGDGALTGLAASVVGAQASDYTPGALGASSLAPGGSTTFDVIFSPTAAGDRTTTLRIASNDANENPFDIALTGSGTLAAPEIVVEQPADTPLTDGLATVNHGVVQITGTSSRTYTLRNTGNAPLTGLALSMTGANAGDFTPGALTSTTLAPAASMTFALTFSPLAGGSRTATLQIASNDADENPFDITVTGTGSLAAPDIAVEQAGGPLFENGSVTVDFGVVVGAGLSSQTFTIRNTGNAPLTGLSLGKTGTHAGDFTLGALTTTTLAQDASTTFTVTFSPGGGGIRTAALQITSNDADENPFDIALTGTAPIPGGNVADNFDDNVLNTAMWLKEDYTEQGTLTESSKRLNYTATVETFFEPGFPPMVFGSGASGLTLLSSQPRSTEDWEVMVDVTNSATAGAANYWEAGAILEIYDANLDSGNRISLELGVFNSGTGEGTQPNEFGRTFVGGMVTDGIDDPAADDKLPVMGTNMTGVLRLAYHAGTKVFTLSVDRSGPSNGLQWETVATYGIAGAGGSRNADWGMTDIDSFQIHLLGFSLDVAVTSGQVAFDNFKLTRSGVSPPAITQQPASRTIVSGQSTPLSVGTSGFPLSYQWYAGATGDTSQPIAEARGAIFTTPALTAEASYWVRVSNSLGSEDSETAVISISASPLAPTFATQPLSQLALLGQSLTFNLTVTGSDPLTYQWRKGTVNITNAKNSSMTLAPLKTGDAGLYSLRSTNGVGTKDSDTAYLGIVTRGLTAVGVNIGTTLTLNAVVTVPAGTSARYLWHQDGVALNNGGRRSGVDTKTLKITGAVPTDAGNYTCQITMVTPAGDVIGNNADTVVSVVEKPVFDAVDLASNFDDVRVGQGIDFMITADNAPTKFIISGLPAGVKLDAATGRIYGVPTAAKIVKGVITPYALKISASNTAGTSDVETVLWTVQPLYPGVIGTYNGLVALDPVNQDLGGTLKLTVASTAGLSGTLKLGALSYTLAGSLNFAGIDDTPAGQIVITRKSPLTTLVIAFEINKDSGELTGSVADDDSGPAELTAWRNPWNSTNKADDYVAIYNTALDPAGGEGPEGYGFMPVKVTNLGAVSWTGKLADGTGITGTTGLGPDGQIAFQHMLYANTGSIQGWLTITVETGHLNGLVNWFKAEQPEKSTTRSYKGGFANSSVTVIGAPYLKPAAAVLGLPTPDTLNAKVTMLCANADFPVDAKHLFTVTSKNVVTPDTPNDYAIKLSLAAATGTFSGSITLQDADPTSFAETPPIIKRTVSYTGILVTREDFNQGAGYLIVNELPFMEPIPDTDRERRVTATPHWSGSAALHSVDE